jgi:hypothetical protein
MVTITNIACAVRGCSNPVIGQCGGYNRSCGRYYCADHSVGSLCSDCTHQKTEHEIYTDYLQTAEKVKRDSTPWGYGCYRGMTSLAVGLGMFAFLLGVGLICLMSMTTRNQVGEVLLMLLPMGVVLGLPVLLYLYESSQVRRRARTKATEIDQTKRGFLQFYEAWDNKKAKDDLIELLAAGGAVAIIMASATAAEAMSSSDKARQEEQIRNAVHDEVRRRGID